MFSHFNKYRESLLFRFICSIIVFTFSFSLFFPNQSFAQSVLNLPAPGSMIQAGVTYTPPLLQGIVVHPENPLEFDFLIHSGDSGLRENELKDETEQLIKYFLTSLTVPDKDLWVNLSPYEKNRIIPRDFGETEMGRDLLAQDYILKQLTASLIYPEDDLGKAFWDEVYTKAQQQYGTTDIPINTFNKVWIVADGGVIYQQGNTAYVLEPHLKVMLEEDYLALEHNINNEQYGTNQMFDNEVKDINNVSSSIVRDIVIPAIEKEVNHGEHFAKLRQIYNSYLLATWYKQALKESLLTQVYADRNLTEGVDVTDKKVKEKIYKQYLEAFQKGVFNYIKEEYDLLTNQPMPRKYFSGGTTLEHDPPVFTSSRGAPDSVQLAIERLNADISGGWMFLANADLTESREQFGESLRVLDSRGNETIEVTLRYEGKEVVFRVPSGASTGEREAVEIRDGAFVNSGREFGLVDADNKKYITQKDAIMILTEGRATTKSQARKWLNTYSPNGMRVAKLHTDYLLAELQKAVAAKEVNPRKQGDIERWLKGMETKFGGKKSWERKEFFGANAILAIEGAADLLAAELAEEDYFAYKKGPLDVSGVRFMGNILNGGEHADNPVDVQETMYHVDWSPFDSDSLIQTEDDAIFVGAQLFRLLKKKLKEKGLNTNVGDEGGFAPFVFSNEEYLKIATEVAQESPWGKHFGTLIGFNIDAAWSERVFERGGETFYWLEGERNERDEPQPIQIGEDEFIGKRETVKIKGEDKDVLVLTEDEAIQYWLNLVNKYPILSIEDPFGENHMKAYPQLTQNINHRSKISIMNGFQFDIQNKQGVKVVGDDFTVTSLAQLKAAVNGGRVKVGGKWIEFEPNSINAILVKINQVGSIGETKKLIKWALEHGISVIISHRSGETEDTTIADLAKWATTLERVKHDVTKRKPDVWIKTGSFSRSDRLAKYNRILEINKMQKMRQDGLNPLTSNFALRQLDSRGNDTLKVWLADSGKRGYGYVPSGASTGWREAIAHVDGAFADRVADPDDPTRFGLYDAAGNEYISDELVVRKITNNEAKTVEEGIKWLKTYYPNGARVAEFYANFLLGLLSVDAKSGKVDYTQEGSVDEWLEMMEDKFGGEGSWKRKGYFGANALLAVGSAAYRLAAELNEVDLFAFNPGLEDFGDVISIANMLNGGEHADNPVDIQEFMVSVIPDPNADPNNPNSVMTDSQAIYVQAQIFQRLKKALKGAKKNEKGDLLIGSQIAEYQKDHRREKLVDAKLNTNVGDEGGFAPYVNSNRDYLEILKQVILDSPWADLYGTQISFALDHAFSERVFTEEGKILYWYEGERNDDGKPQPIKLSDGSEIGKVRVIPGKEKQPVLVLTLEEHLQYLLELMRKYPIRSFEDALGEDDFKGHPMFTAIANDPTSKIPEDELFEVQRTLGIDTVGDDLTVTSLEQLKAAVRGETVVVDGRELKFEKDSINSILVKINQIGSISETFELIRWALKNGITVKISHRSGETEDDLIAHIAKRATTFEKGRHHITQKLARVEIKTGSMSRSDRLAKYNTLLRINARIAQLRREAASSDITPYLADFDHRLNAGNRTVIEDIAARYEAIPEGDRKRQEFSEALQRHPSALAADVLVRIGVNWHGIVDHYLLDAALGLRNNANPRTAARHIVQIADTKTFRGLPLTNIEDDKIYGGLTNEIGQLLIDQATAALDAHPEIRDLAAPTELPEIEIDDDAPEPGVFVIQRHGKTTWGEPKEEEGDDPNEMVNKWAGKFNAEVTRSGRKDAQMSGTALKNIYFHNAFQSHLVRSIQTLAEFLSTYDQDVPIFQFPEFAERDYGLFGGWRRTDVEAMFPTVFADWRRNPDLSPFGAEDLNDVLERSVPVFYAEILSKIARGENIIFSGHNNTNRAIHIFLVNYTRIKRGQEPLSKDEIKALDFPTGRPVGYVFNKDLTIKRILWSKGRDKKLDQYGLEDYEETFDDNLDAFAEELAQDATKVDPGEREKGQRAMAMTRDRMEDTVTAKVGEYGGIDLTRPQLQIKRDQNGLPLPMPYQDVPNMNIRGMYFNVNYIIPATPLILGDLDQEDSTDQLSKLN